ncbi:hypothetical protein [Desulfuromonas sp. TF]|uniref:hypothetical protein n=1 Tax=Desulfuromonas sp. TF TaxID=1232410 RepID=UPI000400EB66|nr:hypothetical protein [Desulfuromonas sp. TF]
MTKEDWEKVEKALSGTYGRAKLKVDGREVTFARGLIDKNRLGIGTYVDGKLRGEWIGSKNEHPEQRYLRPAFKFTHKPKTRATLNKMSKRQRKELGEYWDPDHKYHYFSFWWNNVTEIRRHYQKTFKSIELLEVIGA